MTADKKLYYSIWTIFIVFILATIGIYLWIIRIRFTFDVLVTLDPFQESSITLFIERVKLLSGLATVLISALFIMLGTISSKQISQRSLGGLIWILAGISVWCLSIICGYYTYEIMLDMISHNTLSFSHRLVVIPALLQFIFLLIGFPFLLQGIYSILIKNGRKHE